MRRLKLLAIDPALRNVGLARLVISDQGIEVDDLILVQTGNEAGKTVRKNSDDLRRATEAYEVMKAHAKWADVVAAEIPSGTQSARGAMSNGISLGLLAAIGNIRPLIQITAAEAKKIATGRRTASKDEMIRWAVDRYPDAPWMRKKFKGVMRLLDCNEHLADAVAIGLAAAASSELRSALKIIHAQNVA